MYHPKYVWQNQIIQVLREKFCWSFKFDLLLKEYLSWINVAHSSHIKHSTHAVLIYPFRAQAHEAKSSREKWVRRGSLNKWYCIDMAIVCHDMNVSVMSQKSLTVLRVQQRSVGEFSPGSFRNLGDLK